NVDVWRTALTKDPFKIPPADKAEVLIDIAAEALKVPGVKFCDGSCQTQGEWKLFASSEGAYVEQDITRIGASYFATAVDAASVDKLGKLRYAAPQVTLYADKTTPGALATCGYDDDGVKTQRWDLVKDGLFVGYQTTREQAGWIGEKASRGTSYAQDYRSFPFQRMPNVSLQPGKKDLGVAD